MVRMIVADTLISAACQIEAASARDLMNSGIATKITGVAAIGNLQVPRPGATG